MQNSTPDKDSLLLTAQHAAKLLAISARKLWGLTHSGKIRHVRIDRRVRYDIKDLQRFIDEHKEGGDDR